MLCFDRFYHLSTFVLNYCRVDEKHLLSSPLIFILSHLITSRPITSRPIPSYLIMLFCYSAILLICFQNISNTAFDRAGAGAGAGARIGASLKPAAPFGDGKPLSSSLLDRPEAIRL